MEQTCHQRGSNLRKLHEQLNDQNRVYMAKHLKANFYPVNKKNDMDGKIVRPIVQHYGETTTATGNTAMVTYSVL